MARFPDASVSSPSLTTARPLTLVGHTVAIEGIAGGIMNLQIDLGGEPLVALARALVKLDGVRVTGGPEGGGPGRSYLVSCPGFKMVLSSPADDTALGLVSREPQPPLAVLSEFGSVLDRLMSAPPAPRSPVWPATRGRLTSERVDEDPIEADTSRPSRSSSSSLQRSSLRPGKALARKTELRRKTPLKRGPFRKH